MIDTAVLDQLTRLAKAATPGERGTSATEYGTILTIDGGSLGIIYPKTLLGKVIDDAAEAAFLAALTPDLVLDLLAAARPVEADTHATAVAERDALREALGMFLAAMNLYGDWDDGCFYYGGKSASELQEPIRIARAALAEAAR